MTVESLQTLQVICFVIAALLLLLAVLLFFVWKIPEIFGLLSGRTRKKAIENIRKLNEEAKEKKEENHTGEVEKSKKLHGMIKSRSGNTSGISTEKIDTRTLTSDGKASKETELLGQAGNNETTLLDETKQGENETTLLNETKQGTNETTLLNETKQGTNETTLLNETKQSTNETTLLNETQQNANETTLLNSQNQNSTDNFYLGDRTGELYSSGEMYETSVLNQEMYNNINQGKAITNDNIQKPKLGVVCEITFMFSKEIIE